MEPLRIRLSQAVRELRSAAGYSQEGFAARIEVHRTFMGTIERGRTNLSLDTLERLASGLGMAVWELIRLAEALSPGTREGTPAGHLRPATGKRETPRLRKIAEEKIT